MMDVLDDSTAAEFNKVIGQKHISAIVLCKK